MCLGVWGGLPHPPTTEARATARLLVVGAKPLKNPMRSCQHCGYQFERDGRHGVSVIWRGVCWLFCSLKCLEAFIAEKQGLERPPDKN